MLGEAELPDCSRKLAENITAKFAKKTREER